MANRRKAKRQPLTRRKVKRQPVPWRDPQKKDTTKLIEVAVELTVVQYQTVHVDTSQSGWREQAIAKAEELAFVRGGEIVGRRGEITRE